MRLALSMLGVVACVALSDAALADASELHAQLRWQRPPGSTCIAQGELQQRVEQLIGRRAFVDAPEADLVLQGSIERSGDAWLAKIAVVGRNGALRGQRELRESAADCAALNQALVVVLATLFDAPSDADPIELDDHDHDRGRDAGVDLGLAASAAIGRLPGASFAGGPLLALRVPPLWPIWFDLALSLPVNELDVSGRGAGFWAFGGGVALCPELVQARGFDFALCAGARATALQARGEGLAVERDPIRLLPQASAEAAASIALWDGARARFALAATLALARPGFHYERADGSPSQLYRPGLFGAFANVAFIIGVR